MRKVSDIGSKATDESLLAAVSRGDAHAFTVLYNRYWRKLFVVASNKLKDSAAAEEITQDLFSSIWNRRQTLSIHEAVSKGAVSFFLRISLK